MGIYYLLYYIPTYSYTLYYCMGNTYPPFEINIQYTGSIGRYSRFHYFVLYSELYMMYK